MTSTTGHRVQARPKTRQFFRAGYPWMPVYPGYKRVPVVIMPDNKLQEPSKQTQTMQGNNTRTILSLLRTQLRPPTTMSTSSRVPGNPFSNVSSWSVCLSACLTIASETLQTRSKRSSATPTQCTTEDAELPTLGWQR